MKGDVMAQSRKPLSEKLVKLRVVEKKYMETLTETNKVKIVVAPWLNNKIIRNKQTFLSGETFQATEKEARALLDTGGVQLASEKPVPYLPPFLEHKINLSAGVCLREDILGKHPTREMGSTNINAPWVDLES